MRDSIQQYGNTEGWSFSRTICYLADLGLQHLELMKVKNAHATGFQVDNPKRNKIKKTENEVDRF